MVQPFAKNDVINNTLSTEKHQIATTSKERDAEISILKSQLDKGLEQTALLVSDIKKLREQVALLTSHNQTLQNCWASAIENHTHAEAQTRAWISRAAFKDSELAEARRQILELEAHLNQSEEAA